MTSNEQYIKQTIENVFPLVENLSGFKCNLEGYQIEILDRKNKVPYAKYNVEDKVFKINERILGFNSALFNSTIGHELMHNAQYNSNPDLSYREFEEDIWVMTGRKKENSLTKLIEGDARLIDRQILFHFDNSLKNKIFGNMNYHEWANMIQERFGNNRKKINAFYNSPISSIDSLFNRMN